MTINFNGKITKKPFCVQSNNFDDIELSPLVIPDGEGPWVLRYLWIKHREENDKFTSNYFNEGNNSSGTGLNLRKQTSYLSGWAPHNNIFIKSQETGDLVWRVKVLNNFSNTIDYIEIWKSREILKKNWGAFNNSETTGIRKIDDIKNLRHGLEEKGFNVWMYQIPGIGAPAVSKLAAMEWYKYFSDRFLSKDSCIINTPWNPNANPVEFTKEYFQDYMSSKYPNQSWKN